MKQEILKTAEDLFLNLGFKSVTMDDIANKMGISKKTIYENFSTKTKLVEATTELVFQNICTGIDFIRANDNNPIAELLQINNFIKQYLREEKASPQYQLQKYYPNIFKKLKENQFCVMEECVVENLKKGIALGLYRDSLNPGFIARFYFLGVTGIKDRDLFPAEMFKPEAVVDAYLEYHLRGIVTEKGKSELITHINK